MMKQAEFRPCFSAHNLKSAIPDLLLLKLRLLPYWIFRPSSSHPCCTANESLEMSIPKLFLIRLSFMVPYGFSRKLSEVGNPPLNTVLPIKKKGRKLKSRTRYRFLRIFQNVLLSLLHSLKIRVIFVFDKHTSRTGSINPL